MGSYCYLYISVPSRLAAFLIRSFFSFPYFFIFSFPFLFSFSSRWEATKSRFVVAPSILMMGTIMIIVARDRILDWNVVFFFLSFFNPSDSLLWWFLFLFSRCNLIAILGGVNAEWFWFFLKAIFKNKNKFYFEEVFFFLPSSHLFFQCHFFSVLS